MYKGQNGKWVVFGGSSAGGGYPACTLCEGCEYFLFQDSIQWQEYNCKTQHTSHSGCAAYIQEQHNKGSKECEPLHLTKCSEYKAKSGNKKEGKSYGGNNLCCKILCCFCKCCCKFL